MRILSLLCLVCVTAVASATHPAQVRVIAPQRVYNPPAIVLPQSAGCVHDLRSIVGYQPKQQEFLLFRQQQSPYYPAPIVVPGRFSAPPVLEQQITERRGLFRTTTTVRTIQR